MRHTTDASVLDGLARDGSVHRPDAPGYAEALAGFQTGVPQRPLAVVTARSAGNVRVAVRAAADLDVPVAVQATGHGLTAPHDGLLVSTRRLRGVTVDPTRRTARVEAGTRMAELVAAAAPHGLAPVAGSSPHVGVVGYTLAGGYGLLGRAFGLAADHVRALEVVTADGAQRRVTPDEDADLFRALRGGRGRLGVVTALETDLVAVERLTGGGLFFDAAAAPGVLAAFDDVTADAPDGLTVFLGAIGMPDVPGVPAPLRGRRVLHVRVASVAARRVTDEAVARLRTAGRVLLGDVTDLALTDVGTIVNEPSDPHGYDGTNVLLSTLHPADLTDVLARTRNAQPPCVLDVRPLGGALAAPPRRPSAVPFRAARWLVRVLSPVDATDEAHDAARAVHAGILAGLAPHTLGRAAGLVYGHRVADDELYDADTLAELRRTTRRYDPDGRFGTAS